MSGQTNIPLPEIPPAAARNAEPIREIVGPLLSAHLAAGATILEIASGAGHHAAVLAAALPLFVWQPSEADEVSRARADLRVSAEGRSNLRPAIVLDTRSRPWPVRGGAVVCINMIHISPWQSTVDLFAGAAEMLPADGLVITYGPYRFDGDFGAESNRAFDESLRTRNPEWGVRDVRDIDATALTVGFTRIGLWPMPANNHILAFRKG